ncbi:MAG: hypothetical protein LUF82_01740 [Clostridia bacterium]|nr:hypothetical protein [Clostridia bacterium]
MTVDLNYKKPYGLRYDCYYNNKKVGKRDNIALAEEGELLLIERNIFLSKFWWVLAVFNLLCGLLGSFDDWKDERVKQKKITVYYKNILSDNLIIEVLPEGKVINIKGVESFAAGVVTEEENAVIKKRISISQKLLIIFPLIILAVVLVVLAVCLI